MDDFIKTTSINGLYIIERPVFPDDRGFFHEIFRLNEIETFTGKKFEGVQWSHSFSKPKVLRGVHTEEWQKIVYPVNGKVFIAIADTRPDSGTFTKVESFVFDNTSDKSKHTALYLAPGLGNSICVIGDVPIDYIYLVADYWDNSKAKGIAWNDPDLNIKWPIDDPIISERDMKNPTLRELYPEKFK